MTEIVNDLKKAEKLGEAIQYYPDYTSRGADARGEFHDLIQKYEKPFAPEQLIELGWEKCGVAAYKKEGWMINLEHKGDNKPYINFLKRTPTEDTYGHPIYLPSTHAELLTLLKLVCGEGK